MSTVPRQIRHRAALVLAAAVGAAQVAEASPQVELPARPIELGDGFEAMPAHGLVFVGAARALRRAELDALAGAGARYLGVVARRAYAFELQRPEGAAALIAHEALLGGVGAQPEDRMGPALLRASVRGRDIAGFGLALSFWPRATRAELEQVLGAGARSRLPSSAEGRLGVDGVVFVPPDTAKWLDVQRLLAHPAVATVELDLPRKLANDGSRALAGSDLVAAAPLGLSGSGVTVGHWDGGQVDTSHPDFGNRVENITNQAVDDHATHTAGTVLGSGAGRPASRGHAPEARMIASSFRGDPTGERREVKHQAYHFHDNHSWGMDPDFVDDFGTYNQVALEFDVDARDLLLLPVKAAGNEGRQSEVVIDRYGFDSLSPDSTSKNAMIVGASDARGRLAGYSSRGPTSDGRVKPDVIAVGSGVVSTIPGGGYAETQGTSMAAPGVTGMLALLNELWMRESAGRRMHPDVARGLLIHTAQDAYLDGPDYRYGWGVANVAAAAELVQADRASGGLNIVRGAVREGETVRWTVSVPRGQTELAFTLSWLDAFQNSQASRRLVHDLDLVLVGPDGTRVLPFAPDPERPADPAPRSVNVRDNVEQVRVAAPPAGTYTVEITGTSVGDPDAPVQGFVLISDHPLDKSILRVQGERASNEVPDGTGALEVRFPVNVDSALETLRVFLDLKHEARGDVRVELEAPDGTTVTLEEEDRSARRDIYAVFPDTRSYADDVSVFNGKLARGTWLLRIQDTRGGNVGSVRHAELELDLGGEPNRGPTAIIEGPTQASAGETVRFASVSTDPDGDALVHAWWTNQGGLELRGVSSNQLSFEAPALPVGETLTITLEVYDGRGESDRTTHVLTVEVPNDAPVAQVTGPNEGRVGDRLEFDGSGSTDPNGDSLAFTWRQVSGPTAQLEPDGSRFAFTVPEAEAGAQLGFELEVDDGRASAVLGFEVRVAASETPDAGTDGGSSTDAGTAPLRPNKLDAADGGCRAAGSSTPATLGLLGLGLLFLKRRRRD